MIFYIIDIIQVHFSFLENSAELFPVYQMLLTLLKTTLYLLKDQSCSKIVVQLARRNQVQRAVKVDAKKD